MDLLTDQGLRFDGRRANELRKIRCKLGVFSQPDGSVYLEQGNTKVLAAVYGPHQVIRKLTGTIHVVYTLTVTSSTLTNKSPHIDNFVDFVYNCKKLYSNPYIYVEIKRAS